MKESTEMSRVPDRWIQGRSFFYERQGFTARQSIAAAIEDWNEQERLEREAEREAEGGPLCTI